MQELDDNALLREYAERNSEEAFAALIARHVNKVYSVALRHSGNPHQAEEITQAVFVILARKSRHLSRHVILSGWLYQTTRFTALTLVRSEIRRARREQEAGMLNMADDGKSAWTQIAPLLDDAMARLNEKERHAVVLRFFDGLSLKEVGQILGASEEAAKMRVNRAVEKLRLFFAKQGVAVSTASLTCSISTHSVQIAPATLAKSATAMAVAHGATASTSTLNLIKGVLRIMAWTKAKTAIVAGMAALFVATTAMVVEMKHTRIHHPAAGQPTALSPISEDVTIDMQPDGKIRFLAIIEETNSTARPSEDTVQLNGADQVFRIYDEAGLPMKYSHEAEGHAYLIALAKPVPPGGKIAYTIEGTTIDVIKPNHAGICDGGYSGSEGNVAELHFTRTWRLPVGATLLGKDGAIDQSVNAGRIELHMDKMIPPGGNLTAVFRYRPAASAK